jgi:hypothetical protein
MQAYAVKRGKRRFPSTVQAVVVGRRSQEGIETALTDNISSHGARIITAKEWQRDKRVLIALPEFRFTAAARVAYCEALGDGTFGTGLEFTGTTEDLDSTGLGTSLTFAS